MVKSPLTEFISNNGSSVDVLLQATIPGSDIDCYKINRNKIYRPLGIADLVFGFVGELGYIGAYGDTKVTFFENFYSGGPRSLKSFESIPWSSNTCSML